MTGTAELRAMGWHPSFAAAFAAHESSGHVPARVVAEERGQFVVHDGVAAHPAAVSGRLRYESNGDPLAFPSVGDWVAATPSEGGSPATIHGLMPRRSAIVRRAPAGHATGAQVLAANVDVVFIVTSLNAEMNLRRIERYLAVAWESGALPVIVLSKADLDDDVAGHRVAAEAVAPGVEVIAVSAVSGDGLEAVRAHLAPGRTVAFIGSSGVGKSTLVNALAGHELLTTAGIREDDARGRHTTTRRQLVPLAEGLVIDTPGMRELGRCLPLPGLPARDRAGLCGPRRARDRRPRSRPIPRLSQARARGPPGGAGERCRRPEGRAAALDVDRPGRGTPDAAEVRR
ncbi:MAG: ribosome small subunit-dependent GTPase A [Chloroflexi bacterium]|nr:ribosome small subunit-dependent GTPase A [Chloroflexota bacterium]